MQPPFVIVDRTGADLSVHRSIADAALHLEPPEVRSGEYLAFDAEGRLLWLAVEKYRTHWWVFPVERERVTITPLPTASPNPEELRARLIAYLVAAGEERSKLDAKALSELLTAVQGH